MRFLTAFLIIAAFAYPALACEPGEFKNSNDECIKCNPTQISDGKRCKFCPSAPKNPGAPECVQGSKESYQKKCEMVQLIPNDDQTACVPPVDVSVESIHAL